MLALYVIAALLAALVLANLVFGRLPRRPAGGGGVIETAQGPIHYIENVGEGPPIVFIHGMPGLCREFDRVRAQLPGRHTIAFDRPGYAWSEGPPREFGEQLDAIVEAAGVLGVERAVVVGHSFGGLAALGLAIRRADFVERLLLLAPAGGGTRIQEGRLKQARLIQRIELPVVRQIADLLFLRTLRKYASRQGSILAYGTGADLAEQRHLAQSVLARHNSISVPSVILHGEQDQTVPLRNGRRLAEGLSNTRLIEIPGDHQLPTKNADQVVDVLEQLLAVKTASAAQ
jgi:pimeloyl-ACP methyl ester carboxylesterase